MRAPRYPVAGPLTRRDLLGRAAAVASTTALAACAGESPALRVDEPGTAEDPTSTSTGGTTVPFGGKPNILYIYLDQMRGSAFGAAGDPVAVTPNIDGLAASSVRFARAYTNGPLCRPARAVALSGMYPHQTGIVHNTTLPTAKMPSHVQRIRDDAGYHTMLIGKYHLYDRARHTDDYKDLMATYGYSDCIELLGQTDQTMRESAYSDYLTGATPEGEEDKYLRYIDYVNTYTWTSPPPDVAPWFLSTEDHLDQFCARLIADWIRSYDGAEPFYLQANFPGPHKPFNGTSEFRSLYDAKSTPFPRAILEVPVDPSPLVQTYLGIKFEEWTDETWADLAVAYYATVSLVDDAIGQVLAALEETGRLEDTWIVLGGDHGEMLGDHMLTGKVVFYEGSIHQPLLIRPPGGIDPWMSEALVDQTDVTATILAIAGLETLPEAPGLSLLDKVLEGPAGVAPQHHRTEIFGGNLGFYFIRSEQWLAGFDPVARVITELFDLVADPDERVNRAGDPALEVVRTDLIALFGDYLAAWPVGEGIVAPGPADDAS